MVLTKLGVLVLIIDCSYFIMGSNTAKMLDSEATIKRRSAVSIYLLSKTGLPYTQIFRIKHDILKFLKILLWLRVTRDVFTFFKLKTTLDSFVFYKNLLIHWMFKKNLNTQFLDLKYSLFSDKKTKRS